MAVKHALSKKPEDVAALIENIILDDLSLEDEINAEARALLNQYGNYMRAQNIAYHEMFAKVKRQILAERKVVSAAASSRGGERSMKIARDKALEFSHKIAAKLPRIPGTRLNRGWNDTRLEIQNHLIDMFVLEEKIDQKARETIRSQKREIPEGSEEWQIQHRRYYEDELKKYGVYLTRETPGGANLAAAQPRPAPAPTSRDSPRTSPRHAQTPCS